MNKSLNKILLAGLASTVAFSLSASEQLHGEDAYIRAMPPGQEVTAASSSWSITRIRPV